MPLTHSLITRKMFYSDKHKLLFIASPKSGSTSIEKLLYKIDENGENHTMTVKGKMFTGKDIHSGVMGHARAWEILDAIGGEVYDGLNVFGFVRHPIDKLISSYYFSRKKDLFGPFKYVGEKKLWQRRISGFIARLSTRILPLSLWVLIFPMKTSYEYFHDRNGNRIVKYLGRTDHLKDDLIIILESIGIEVHDQIPHENRSKHKNRNHHIKSSLLVYVLSKKYKNDIELYEKVEKEVKDLSTKIED